MTRPLLSSPPPRRSVRSMLAVISGLVVGAGLLVAGPAPQVAAGTVNEPRDTKPRPIAGGWMPYWTPDSSLASLRDNADLFGEVTGFWHSATSARTIVDQLSDERRAEIVRVAHNQGVRVLGAVTDGTPARRMAAIMNDPERRADHIKALVRLAVANDYDGIDLDYEKFAWSDGSSTWATTRPDWVRFVRQLSEKLHAKGLWLTVAVPVMYDDDRDGSSGYWVYDYAGIGPYVDRLRIMTYDYSVYRPGPIAPISWVRRVLDFAVTQVPSEKIQVGVPAYGRDWPTTTDGCPKSNLPARYSLTSSAAQALARDKGKTAEWDATHAERTFSYKKTYRGTNKQGDAVSCRIKRTVWFEEESATMRRAKLVEEYKLAGIAQWAIGGEDPGQWSRLRDYARSIAKVSPRVELFAGDTDYGRGITVSGTVRNAAGNPVAGEDWRLYWRDRTASRWEQVATGTTSGSGTMSVDRQPTRTGFWRLWVGGSWARYAAETAENRTRVRVEVTAAFGRAAVDRNETVSLRGSVAPSVGGLLVERQRKLSDGWVTVGTTRTDRDGSYAMKVTPTERGLYTYRVKVSGSKQRSPGLSPVFTLTVR